MNRISAIIISLSLLSANAAYAGDSVPSGFSRPLEWRMGVEVSPAWVPSANIFLKGSNPKGKNINANFSGDLRAAFSFSPSSREGILYKGLYQGLGVGVNTYFAKDLLGTPLSAYVYQGAPIVRFNNKFWLGYEWQFGAAFGWKHYDGETAENNGCVSTSVTAHMGIGVKVNYSLSQRWQMSLGVVANHYSNGNTSWPNAGVNSIGASLGIAYVINPSDDSPMDNTTLEEIADSHTWHYDIMAFGAWRKRVVCVGDPATPQLCPGKFGILGMQFSPLYKLNRWVAIGPALDMQWDESAGLDQYWVDGTSEEKIQFERPPFGKQLSIGASAHAELTMPIFSVNAGIGYDFINPKGERRFYQMLTLKTFVTKFLYLNVGYRLGSFKDPQNLMLGIGVRL